jgi:hypothetical protein
MSLVVGVACCAAAAAASTVTYRAGRPSKPPYVVVTVANRTVVKVRWGFELPCAAAMPLPGSATNKLDAKIRKHGHFAATISYTSYGGDITTRFTGTITSTTATIKITDQELIPSYGGCFGSHTFTAAKT